jgi:pimeloyl-ACP methyl ester carboxylesterase
MASFVLVSGSWHAAWCWERITPLLEAKGHRVAAPDLLGMGKDPTPAATVTLAGWAEQVADIIRAEPEPVVLVGHSRGGVVISEAAERVPDKIRTLVYLAAVLLPSGATVIDLLSRIPREGDQTIVVTINSDGSGSLAPGMAQSFFYNKTAPDWVARAESQLCPEPGGGAFTPLTLSAARYGRVPRAYIECLQDRAIPVAMQRAMREALPCDPVITMNTDHSPFYSAPDALAGHLMAIAAGLTS